jgi:hypothetical protein
MNDLFVSCLFLIVLWFFAMSLLASIHPKAPGAIKKLIKLAFKVALVWPLKVVVAGIKNFIWPPYDEIHNEPPPRLQNREHRGDRP